VFPNSYVISLVMIDFVPIHFTRALHLHFYVCLHSGKALLSSVIETLAGPEDFSIHGRLGRNWCQGSDPTILGI
jgi:hypothetical protein